MIQQNNANLLEEDVPALLDQKLVLWGEVDVGVLPELNRGRGESGVLVVDHALLNLPTRKSGLDQELGLALILDCERDNRLSQPRLTVIMARGKGLAYAR
jgi:hypothetical protein